MMREIQNWKSEATIEEQVARCSELAPSHAVSMHDFTREALESLFDLADTFKNTSPRLARSVMSGKVIGTLFYQPSTRTRLNFHAAAQRLGAGVIGFSDPATTRAGDYYQESVEDVVAFTSVLCDLLVLRHHETGTCKRVVEFTSVPLISGGDGYNEHPTQALGDIYTMHRLLKGLDSRSLGFIGDLNIRSLRAILIGLRHYRIRRYLFLLPPGMTVPDDARDILSRFEQPWEIVNNADDMLAAVDLIETIGVNHPNHNLSKDTIGVKHTTPEPYRVTRAKVERHHRFIPILHPGPRTDEIDTDTDALPGAQYFEQARNGMWMRMALMTALMQKHDALASRSAF
jgi:aspartate carbamoyltransferase catalytic subunit